MATNTLGRLAAILSLRYAFEGCERELCVCVCVCVCVCTCFRQLSVGFQVPGFVWVIAQNDVCFGVLVVSEAHQNDVSLVDPHLRGGRGLSIQQYSSNSPQQVNPSHCTTVHIPCHNANTDSLMVMSLSLTTATNARGK